MDLLSNYDYRLPGELIAAEPLPGRDQARLMVVDRRTGRIEHQRITDLPTLLNPGDSLVLNDTRVLPARLLGHRTSTGGRWEGLFLGTVESGAWKLMGQCRGKLQPGEQITLVSAHHPDTTEPILLTLLEQLSDGSWIAAPPTEGDVPGLLERYGTVPLPPYIGRTLATELDRQRYQTTFARNPGAVAAPTAGLHFTQELLAECSDRSIEQAFVTLHVGVGTFRPISCRRLSEHQMHAEWCALPETTAEQLNRTRAGGGRIVAVGTTSVRTLESAAASGCIEEFSGETDIFIRPPYEFRAVDCLLTNFHLPKSTLFVLVSALAGCNLIQEAYACAIRERYRFYSYGDAMLIV